MSVLDGHVALGAETTYGTAVATTRGVLCNPQEWSFGEEFQRITSSVRLPGQTQPTTTFGKAFMGVTGQGSFEALDKGLGVWLEHALGGVTNIAHPVEATMRRMTFVPDATAKVAKSMSLQAFKPYMDTGGKAFTYLGMKILGFKASCDVGANVKFAWTLDGRDVANSGDVIVASITTGTKLFTVPSTVGLSEGMALTGTGVGVGSVIDKILSATTFNGTVNNTVTNATANVTVSRNAAIAKATPTYASGAQPFTWNAVALTIDGVNACAQGWEISMDWAMKTDRRYMCNGGLKDSPVAMDLIKGTLSLKGLEFLVPAGAANQYYNRFAASTSQASLGNFSASCLTAGPAANSTKGKLDFNIATAVQTTGVPDMKAGQPADFEILGSPGLQVVYDTLDATP